MMGALIRALTNNAVENIEEALGMTDATSSAMKHAIAEWYAAWYGRAPTKTEDPCQRLPYAIVNKLCKATFGEYDSGLQHTDSAKAKYLDGVRSTFDACKTSFMTQAMIGGEAWAKPVPMPDGRLTWQIVGRDSVIILGRDASGIPSDVALCEKSVSADHHFYTLVERRTSFAGRLTIRYRLYCSDNKSTLGRRVPLASLPQYERLEDEYTFAVPIDGVGMVFLRMPITNCVDGSADGVSIYEPAMGLIHRINENELQFSREFELGRMRVVASADILRTHNGKKSLTDDVFVGLDGNEQSVGITPFAPALRNESYEARRQTYLKAIENLLGIKRGILSDAEAVSKTATEINCMGTFYLDDWSNEDDTLADFTAIDTIGLLDGSPFDGGVYDTHVASLAAEILSGYPYTLDSVLGEERIQGYIPAGTRREALQQLAFAIGAVVDCSRGEIIRIVPAPQRASGLIGTDRRLQDGSKVTLLALVTAVSVTAHRYIPGEASEELYKDTLEPGTYRVTFDAPAVADSLAVRGAELSERGVNHCTLTVSKAAEVCVTGRKYSDSATVLRREASNLPSNAQGNEVSVPDATLVSPDRAAAVAARVLDYYAQRYEQTFRMVAGDEKLADRLIVESFGGEMVRGVVTKLEFDLTGGFLADAKIVGRKLSNNAAAYAGEEIHAGERSFI